MEIIVKIKKEKRILGKVILPVLPEQKIFMLRLRHIVRQSGIKLYIRYYHMHLYLDGQSAINTGILVHLSLLFLWTTRNLLL